MARQRHSFAVPFEDTFFVGFPVFFAVPFDDAFGVCTTFFAAFFAAFFGDAEPASFVILAVPIPTYVIFNNNDKKARLSLS